jgi:hypothetical protein
MSNKGIWWEVRSPLKSGIEPFYVGLSPTKKKARAAFMAWVGIPRAWRVWYTLGYRVVPAEVRRIISSTREEEREKAEEVVSALRGMVNIGYPHDEGCNPTGSYCTSLCKQRKKALDKARCALIKWEDLCQKDQ